MGIFASSIASSASLRNSLSFIWLLAASLAVGVDDHPQVLGDRDAGDRDRVLEGHEEADRERSSGSASVMSSPLKVIVPSVTSSAGWPMIALASVDLPDPFGPISAWTLPLLDLEVEPLEDLLALGAYVQVV